VKCPRCGTKIVKNGFRNGLQMYRCKNNHTFNENALSNYKNRDVINVNIDEYTRFKKRKTHFDKNGMLILPPSVRKNI